MAGPFANPWQYAVQERRVGRCLRWCVVNTCHNRIVSDHDTAADAATAIAERLAFLKALNDLRAYCKGDKTPVFVLPLPSCDGQFSLHFPTPEGETLTTPKESAMKRSTAKPVGTASKKSSPPPAVKVDTIAELRSEAARKAWATRRAKGWTHPSAAPKPAPIPPPSPVTRKRVATRQLVRA